MRAIWLSRHSPLPKQVLDLRARGIEIIAIIPSVETIEEILEIIKKHDAKYIIPVLPLSMIAKLLEKSQEYGFTILFAEMETIHNGVCSSSCGFNPILNSEED